MTSQQLVDPFGLVGTTLHDQYRVEKVVGEGGFGVVYKGRHLSLEQPIAIKALKVANADEPGLQDALYDKFKVEAQLLYTLSQASLQIVRSIDFGAVTAPTGLWAPFMILEWLEGRSLAEDIAARRQRGLQGRTLDEALTLLDGAAEGLSVAHERRVAHRDVKPANFFLVTDRGTPRLKVLDFGIAKVLREDDTVAGTRSKFASFTWAYAAPEQVDLRYGTTSLATDVYAFTLVLTELLTDRPPIDAKDVVSLMKSATDPTIRPTPRQRGANVPDAVEVVCRRALAVDPRQRFQTMGELWAALQAARGGKHPITAPSAAAGRISAAASTGLPAAQAPSQVPTRATNPPPQAQALPPTAWAPTAPPHAVPQHTGQPYPPRMSGPGGPIVPYSTGGPLQPQPPTGWGPRRMVPTGDNTIVVFIILMVLSGMFVATCAAVHSCGG